MKLKNIITIVVCIALPLMVGGIAGYATSASIGSWYSTLHKPFFNPPNWLFGPVWTCLYILMGISLYIIWKSPATATRTKALRVFLIQLTLNFAWSFIFFYFHETGWALIEIVMMWVSILIMILTFYRINKIAAYLQVPYLLWVSFATVLNASIWYLNR
ncbi:MAG: tryptophan-rich sensory protein [Pyrinomonadaceae bacterium]|nr:tryptophan-rich sensory protein [Sphingobacteriaceae bacterium]